LTESGYPLTSANQKGVPIMAESKPPQPPNRSGIGRVTSCFHPHHSTTSPKICR